MKTKIEYTLHQITVPVQTKPWPENLVEALNANVPDREQVPLPLTQDQHDGINIALSKMDLEKRTILLNLYKGGQTAQELADFYLTSVERVHLFETDGLRFLLRPECLGRIRFGEQHYLLDREMQTRRAEEKTADTDLSLEDLLVRKCRTPVENLSISVYAAHMLYFARIKTVWDLLLFFAGYPGALNRIRGVGEKNRAELENAVSRFIGLSVPDICRVIWKCGIKDPLIPEDAAPLLAEWLRKENTERKSEEERK